MIGKPLVSVIIPSFNQALPLRETLEALSSQTLSTSDFEVIVVDDGSTDSTQDVVSSLVVPYRCHLLRQNNRGAAAARNRGAAQASADLLLFLDADIIAAPQLIAAHLESHRTYERVLVAGRRKPWPAARTSLVTSIIDFNSNISELESGDVSISFQQAFTANLSIKKAHSWLLGGFDEEFPGSGYEDIEFAYRATRSGFEVIYNPEAIGYHNHPMTLEQLCQRMRSYKASATLLLKKHPELRGQIASLQDKEPISLQRDSPRLLARKVARQLLALRPMLSSMHLLVDLVERWWASPRVLRFLYWKILGSYQLIGYREGLKRCGQ